MGPGDGDAVTAASGLFDGPADRSATERFLASPGHHLLIAYEAGRPVGFVSGIEMTHPDKGTEMFLYELAVDKPYRGRGIGKSLVEKLAEEARDGGCYDMWVMTDADNDGALATYRSTGSDRQSTHVMVSWTLTETGQG
jgi:ribosomal protein S18 acetylase RimI-like enzyme